MSKLSPSDAFARLCATMDLLRSTAGCEWDRAQTLKTLRAYLLEETHEVLAILDALDDDGGSRAQPTLVQDHKSELGDLLLQVVFQSAIQRDAGRFDVGDVCTAIHDKLVRRHPHLFGAHDDGAPRASWEAIKRQERDAAMPTSARPASALDGVPQHLPALLRAYRTGEKARGVGFDWPDHVGVVDKIKEELGELQEALDSGQQERISSELGDLLYAIVNLARHKTIDPEAALRGTMARFEQRFRVVEQLLAQQQKTPEQCTLDELEATWQQAKRQLASSAPSVAVNK